MLRHKKAQKQQHDILYAFHKPESEETVIHGMIFAEFVAYSPHKIKNIMTLSDTTFSQFVGATNQYKFSIYEGIDDVQALSNHDIYRLGDFCFIDYAEEGATDDLSPQEVAELLFLGHTSTPMKPPFYESAGNKYAYVSHDDGYYTRVYCRNAVNIAEILAAKIENEISVRTRRHLIQRDDLKILTRNSMESGLMIDFSKLSKEHDSVSARLYEVGEISSIEVLEDQKSIQEQFFCDYKFEFAV